LDLPEGVVVLHEADWEQQVMHAPEPVIVGFWAEWCVPCHMAAPALESAARHYGGRVRFGVVNVDEEPGLARRYDIKGLPTVLVMKRGEICQRRVGLMGRVTLRSLVDGCLG
jgi:thioredoxin 1